MISWTPWCGQGQRGRTEAQWIARSCEKCWLWATAVQAVVSLKC